MLKGISGALLSTTKFRISSKMSEEYEDWNEYQEGKEEEGLTMEEQEELEILHEEEMAPTQEEEDFMLLAIIKEERAILAKKYLPVLSNYKVEDICKICDRYFYKKGNLELHIRNVHFEEKNTFKVICHSSRRLADKKSSQPQRSIGNYSIKFPCI